MKRLDDLNSKLSKIENQGMSEEIGFELEFVLYRLRNIHSYKEIKDTNLEKSYQMKKLTKFIEITEFPKNLVNSITNNEIEEISKMKFSEFPEYGKKLKDKLSSKMNKRFVIYQQESKIGSAMKAYKERNDMGPLIKLSKENMESA